MPNWATGCVTVTGTREGLKSFIERFVNDKEPLTVPGKRFFARSFLCDHREDLIHNAELLFDGKPENEEATMELAIDFAWSAYGCIIEGYPQKNLEECLTLAEACVEDGVSVEIRTTELGMCFREEISCDKEGHLTHIAGDLSTYQCQDCGESTSFDPYEDPEDMECSECGSKNLVWLSGETKADK